MKRTFLLLLVGIFMGTLFGFTGQASWASSIVVAVDSPQDHEPPWLRCGLQPLGDGKLL